jgi:predicted AAA+ superfamily ATPase
MSILRPDYLHDIQRLTRTHPILALLGPRQCGKTTLARMYFATLPPEDLSAAFDLENPRDLAKLEQPLLALEKLQGLVVIDEIQRVPDLFPVLRYLIDRPDNRLRFLILGSASKELIKQSSESLAGRIAYLELTPFSYGEVDNLDQLWLRGGFPRSYLADTLQDSNEWREFYITNFLERDLPNLGIQIPAAAMRRFWTMLSHYHGNILNSAELARSMGIGEKMIREYLDILQGTFMIRHLQPWHANLKKRQVRSPKIYVRDSGLLHSLLGIHDQSSLFSHPKLGASWEGFALETIIHRYQAYAHECFFWATHSGAELDLLIHRKNKKIGFEFKFQDAPKMTKSMKIAFEDLALDELYVITPSDIKYSLADNVHVMGLSEN